MISSHIYLSNDLFDLNVSLCSSFSAFHLSGCFPKMKRFGCHLPGRCISCIKIEVDMTPTGDICSTLWTNFERGGNGSLASKVSISLWA